MSIEYESQLRPKQKAEWFVGLLAVAASVELRNKKPNVSYRDTVDRLLILQNVFGGSITLNKSDRAIWKTGHILAREIESAVAPYAKSPELFHTLVENKHFVAGVVDGRGFFSLGNRNRLRLQTYNKPLLEALRKKYGGTIRAITQAGQVVTIRGKKTTVRRGTYSWDLLATESVELLADIKAYMLLRTDEANRIVGRKRPEIDSHLVRRLVVHLEHGGKLNFSVSTKNSGRTFSYPRIIIPSKNYGLLQSLKADFNGNVFFNQQSQYGAWELRGEHAARIAIALSRWSNLLPEHINEGITAFRQWFEEKTVQGRLAIAQQYRGRN